MELNPQYQIEKPLGKSGGFSNIFLGYDKEKKRDVIIKKIDRLKTTEELFDREINNMKKMKCINIVEYYDHYIDKDYYYIIMEKCDEDLYDFLEKNGPLSDLMIKNILIQLNKAFLAMRSNNIIHRDLKPENILIKYNSSNMNEFTIKLADFGTSREYNKKSFSTQIGTLGYAAPELLEKSNYDPGKCDLWAIGVIIYQLKFNDKPFLKFYSNNIPNTIENVELDNLMKKLIVVEQNKRISWEDYFNHDFLK
jgi:serine/threonine protein kinase